MNAQKTTRRKFLQESSGAATAATAFAVPTAEGSSTQLKKMVIHKPHERPSSATILSSGMRFGNLLFVSGQGAVEPRTGKLIEGPFAERVRQTLENVKTVLEAGGSSLERVLKCTVFLTDIDNFAAMNEVYHTFFPIDPPARSTVAVKDLPLRTPVEIECIAYVD